MKQKSAISPQVEAMLSQCADDADEKQAILEKHAAGQSAKMQRARDKVTAETVERKGIKNSAERPAASDKT